MKTFNIKIYDKDNTFKKVINPDLIQSDIRFTAQKNGGQGDLTVFIKGFDTDIIVGDIVKVYLSSDLVVNKLIYTGYVEQKDETIDRGKSTVITAIGLGSYLTNIIFQSGGSRSFTLNKLASEIITDIITYAGTINSIITAGTVETTTGDINIEFDNNNCFEAIQKVVDLTDDYYFYVNENGEVNFLENDNTDYYRVTFQKDLQLYENNTVGEIYNKLYLDYDGGSQTYTDPTSIGLYGTFEKRVNDTSIKDVATADDYGATFLTNNAYPKQNRSIEINDEFQTTITQEILAGDLVILAGDETITIDDPFTDIAYGFEVIQPGKYVKILNFDSVVLGQIEKLNFNKDKINITLDKNYNFINLIKN